MEFLDDLGKISLQSSYEQLDCLQIKEIQEQSTNENLLRNEMCKSLGTILSN